MGVYLYELQTIITMVLALTVCIGMSRHYCRKLCVCVWLQAKLVEMEARLRVKEAGQSNPPLTASEGLKHSSTNGSSAARYGTHANRLACFCMLQNHLW